MSNKMYILYVDDEAYGIGKLEYIRELINDLLDMELYDCDITTFKIVEKWRSGVDE